MSRLSAAPEPSDKRINLNHRNAEDEHVNHVIKLEVITGGRQLVPMLLTKADTGRLPWMRPQMTQTLAHVARTTGDSLRCIRVRLIPFAAVGAIIAPRHHRFTMTERC